MSAHPQLTGETNQKATYETEILSQKNHKVATKKKKVQCPEKERKRKVGSQSPKKKKTLCIERISKMRHPQSEISLFNNLSVNGIYRCGCKSRVKCKKKLHFGNKLSTISNN